MKKLISIFLGLFLLLGFTSVVQAYTPSSTNDINRTNQWAHVNATPGVGEVTLELVQPRAIYSCFEYRTDGDTSQFIDEEHFLEFYGVVDEPEGLQQYPYDCLSTIGTLTKTMTANEYVEVRMISGGEGDERFDWTRFDVQVALTTPEVLGFLNPTLSCDALTNIHATTVDWTDSTGGVGGIAGYEYAVDYPLVGGGTGHWTTFLTPSQRYGTLNEGLHTIQVRAKDNAGNYSEWSNECSITADWTAPEISWVTPINDGTYSGTIPLKAECNEDCDYVNFWWRAESELFSSASKRYHYVHEDGTTFEWGLDTMNALMADGTSYLMEDGRYYLYAAGKDLAGNWAKTRTIMVNVNNTPDDKDECKKDGWRDWLNPDFRNQGDCVSFVQTQGKSYMSRTGNIW